MREIRWAGIPMVLMSMLLAPLPAAAGEPERRAERPVAGKPRPKPVRGPLSRRKPVPPGVAAQLRHFNGVLPCGGSDDELMFCAEPAVGTVGWQVPGLTSVDVTGAEDGIPLTVTVTSPSGRLIRTWTTTRSAGTGWALRLRPGDETGTYVLRAAQGARSVTETLETAAATRPSLIPLPDDPHAVAFPLLVRGGTIRVEAAGFPPRARVMLPVYRLSRTSAPRYLTSHPVTVGENGAGIWELPTYAGDPVGCYAVLPPHLATGAEEPDNHVEFCLRAGG